MKSSGLLFAKQGWVIWWFWLFMMVLLCGPAVSEGKFLNATIAEITPRIRLGSYASSTIGTRFLGLEDLGRHSYLFSLSEKNGILYTCKAGHIDTAHLRKAADWTAYLAAKTRKKLCKGETKFSFKLMEPSLYLVEISYPGNWAALPAQKREDIAYDVSIRLGRYFAYTATTWHEILTWFGYKCTGVLYSEFPSAFTWEDVFSNLLGTYIGALALRDSEHEYNEAVTLALGREMEKLGVQPGRISRRAAEKVRGRWFTGDWLFFIDMKKRNFDIGLDDGYVTPAIVPSVRGCEAAQPEAYPVPTANFLSEYGFSMKFEIEPREAEKHKILSIVYPDHHKRADRIDPMVHFAPIMAYIKEDAIKKYGPGVDLCDTTARRLAEDAESPKDIGGSGNAAEAGSSSFNRLVSGTVTAGDIGGEPHIDFEDVVVMACRWLEPGKESDQPLGSYFSAVMKDQTLK